jgi:hypothetical protein
MGDLRSRSRRTSCFVMLRMISWIVRRRLDQETSKKTTTGLKPDILIYVHD